MGLRVWVAVVAATYVTAQVWAGKCATSGTEKPCADSITPNLGSDAGATRITITGTNFAKNNFNFGDGNSHLGNTVDLVSDTRKYACDIHPDGCTETQITCYTVKMVEDDYYIRVTVDGVSVTDEDHCGSATSSNCRFKVKSSNTPTITSLNVTSGPPDDLICAKGKIFTDKYGTNVELSSNGNDIKFLRVWITGGLCELVKPDGIDDFYHLRLDSETSNDGELCCKTKTTYVGNRNLSFILDGSYGRSEAKPESYKVGADGKIYNQQSYALISNVSPQKGSTVGGTILTIDGNFFDASDSPAKVWVGGHECLDVQIVAQTRLTCKTPVEPANKNTIGNRGMFLEIWNDTDIHKLSDTEIMALSTTPVWSGWLDQTYWRHDDDPVTGKFVSRSQLYFKAPKDSDYKFILGTDGSGALYMSTDGNRANKVLVGRNDNYYTKLDAGAAQSNRMPLTKGDVVYLEVIQIERALTGPASAQLAVYMYNTEFRAEHSSEAKNEIHEVKTTSVLKNEIQTVSFENTKSASGTKEVQAVTVTSSNQATAYFSLGWNQDGLNMWSSPINLLDCSSVLVENAVNFIPGIEDSSKDKVKASVVDVNGGKRITITFSDTKGDYKEIKVKKVSGSVTSKDFSEVTKGKSSGSRLQFQFGSAVSPVITDVASSSSVKNAIDVMLQSRCPLYITTRLANAGFQQDFEKDTAKSSGVRTDEVEPFCGQYSAKYATSLLYRRDSQGNWDATGVKATNPIFCFAFRGVLTESMYVRFLDENKDVTGTWIQPFTDYSGEVVDDSNPLAWETWRYRCVDLLKKIQAVKSSATSAIQFLEIKVFSNDNSKVLFVDAVSLSQAAPTPNMADQAIPVDMNSFRANNLIRYERVKPKDWYKETMTLTKVGTEKKYQIELQVRDCHSNLPYLTIMHATVASSGNTRTFNWPNLGTYQVVVERIQASSPAVGGTYDLKIGTHVLSSIPAAIDEVTLAGKVRGMNPGLFGNIEVTRTGRCSGYTWLIEHVTVPGDKPNIESPGNNLQGNQVSFNVATAQDGGVLWEKLPGDMISTGHHTKPQVVVKINGMSSRCDGSCDYEWDSMKTPIITAVTPTTGSNPKNTVLTITGLDFAITNDNNVVMIGGVACPAVTSTATQITCTIGEGPVGEYKVNLRVKEWGEAKHQGGTFNFVYEFGLLSIGPTSSGSLAGGFEATITGSGFSATSVVKIDNVECVKKSQTYSTIVCTVPKGSSNGAKDVTVVDGSRTATNLAVKFTYETLSATITALSDNVGTIEGGKQITISGNNFGASVPSNNPVTVGGVVATNVSWSDTSIGIKLPSMSPGVYDLQVKVSDKGYAQGNKKVTYYLEVTNVYPQEVSYKGGAMLTITGRGFSTVAANNMITFGETNCTMDSNTQVTETQVICRLGDIATSYEITNHGYHPDFGTGYQWTPADLALQEGDTAFFKWNAPLPTLGFRVVEVNNFTATEDLPNTANTFRSGLTQKADGEFKYQVVERSEPYIVSSGKINQAGTVITYASFSVGPKVDVARYLNFTINGIEAEYKLGGSDPSNKVCPNTLPGTCDQVTTMSIYESSRFKVQGRKCITPTITSITPRAVPDKTNNGVRSITITGTGFSTDTNCPNKVLIDKDALPGVECTVNTGLSTATKLVCELPTICDSVPVGMPLSVDVLVSNHGYAVHTQINKELRGVTIMPEIIDFQPKMGSIVGGSNLTITGRNFIPNLTTPCGTPSGRRKRSLLKDHLLNVGSLTTSISISICSSIQVINPTTIHCVTKQVNPPQPFVSTPITVIVQTTNVPVTAVCRVLPCSFNQVNATSPLVNEILRSVNGVDKQVSDSNIGISDNSQTLKINGANLGSSSEVSVTIGASTCTVDSQSTATQVLCSTADLIHGLQPFKLTRTTTTAFGTNGDAIVQQRFQNIQVYGSIKSLSHNTVGLGGGLLLTITGFGFDPAVGATTVTIGGSECKIPANDPVTYTIIKCETPALADGSQQVLVKVNNQNIPSASITYSSAITPTVTLVSPTSGTPGSSLSISGTNFGTTLGDITVKINNTACTVTGVTDATVTCTAGDTSSGSYNIKVMKENNGLATGTVSFQYNLGITSISPNAGSTGGGQDIIITGTGFHCPSCTKVTICGNPCNIDPSTFTISNIKCTTPRASSGNQAQCDVVVTNMNTDTQTSANGYNYNANPTVTGVSPSSGGTGGGTRITIGGTGFGSSANDVQVSIAGTTCDIQSITTTQIVCDTNSHKPSVKAKVEVRITTIGIADQISADFEYIDRWSSPFSWNYLPPPEAGTLVVIPKTMTIVLDQSTPTLKLLLIDGGKVIFENKASADITLNAEIILITNGGTLQVGTEAVPYEGKATIQLHGHVRSTELPIYGAKVLAVRQGTLDLHGKDIPNTWTVLDGTVNAGVSTITLKDDPTGWKVGDDIVIASTGHHHSQIENEKKKIAGINGKVITLDTPLAYKHMGEDIAVPSTTKTLEARAEVGLLTRNVIVRGSNSLEWNDTIEACDAGFDTGEFATQTCFEGRHGEEIGSDQFGAQILMHAPKKNQNDLTARISGVELTYVGQAFRLGRYAIHFHLNGDMSGSYVRKCGVHQSFNRVCNIHGTNNVLVERNVAYNIMGGAFFLEDGIEIGNTFQYNLAVFVRQSTSLQNDDITPAAYWVTNANNTHKFNHAAGGTHFGFWYRIHAHPDAASFDPDYCPRRVYLALFQDNVVHSQGWFGIWIFMIFTPMACEDGPGCCQSTIPQAAVFERLTAWNCEKGGESVGGGALQFKDFLFVNNDKACFEFKLVEKEVVYYSETQGTMLEGGICVARFTQLESEGTKDNLGIVLPQGRGLIVKGVTFVNFNQPNGAIFGIAVVQGTTADFAGSYYYIVEGSKLENSPNIAWFKWQHEGIIHDKDGSLTGTAGTIVPTMGTLPASCVQNAKYSLGAVQGSWCPADVKFHRIGVNHALPSSIEQKNITWTNTHGSVNCPFKDKSTTHKQGWECILVSNIKTEMGFENALQITNISYDAKVYDLAPDQWVIITHKFYQSPDALTITGNVTDRSKSPNPVSNANIHGDYSITHNSPYYEASYLVSGKLLDNDTDVWPGHVDRKIDFEVYRCQFAGCELPTDPNLVEPPTTRPNDSVVWHDQGIWITDRTAGSNMALAVKSSEQLNTDTSLGVLPSNRNMMISSSTWVVVDQESNVEGKDLFVYGVLEFEFDVSSTKALTTGRRKRATTAATQPVQMVFTFEHILVSGGRLICGWPGKLMENQVTIRLKGNYFSPDMMLPGGSVNLGAKAIGAFGAVEMHGQTVSHSWTRLSATANAGAIAIFLDATPNWKAGDEIVIAGTAFNPYESEKRTIASIGGNKITLTAALKYKHIGVLNEKLTTTDTFKMSAEVGLLTRNIKIEGMDYDRNGNPGGMAHEGFGGRVLVGEYNDGIQTFTGYARLSNVEFIHMGQEGWTDYYDPRFALAYTGLGDVDTTIKPSGVKSCSFHEGYNTAIGVYGTNKFTIEKNVLYSQIGKMLVVEGSENKILENMVTEQIYLGNWNGRTEEKDTINAALEVNKATDVEMRDNSVSNYERAGYRIDGESCATVTATGSKWSNNVAHSGLVGVTMVPDERDGISPCTVVNGFTAWRNWDWGLYFELPYSLKVTNCNSLDNTVGLLPFIYFPDAVGHTAEDKFVEVTDCHFVGTSSTFDCNDKIDDSVQRQKILLKYSPRQRPWFNGMTGMNGLVAATFSSGTNNAPKKPWSAIMAYSAINGKTTVTDTTFMGFGKACGTGDRNYALTSPQFNDDVVHPMYLNNVRAVGSFDPLSKAYFNDPNKGRINPSDCVDMACDGLKKNLIRDVTGNFLGSAGASLIPIAEKRWDGDKVYGIGDYRIPKVLQTDRAGNRIDVNQISGQGRRGIYRDQTCVQKPNYNAYLCTTPIYVMLHLESMDHDTETRRVSPIAVQSGVTNAPNVICPTCYLDLVNGPMDHGWCMGYTCQKRLSLFPILLPTNEKTHLVMTGTTPQHLRLHYLNAGVTEASVVGIWYSSSIRLDVMVNGIYILPNNGQLNSQRQLILSPVTTATVASVMPKYTDNVGNNYFDSSSGFLYVNLKGPSVVDIVTSPEVVVAFSVPSMTIDNFFGPQIVTNLALFLGISTAKIRVAHAVRDNTNGRKKRNSDILVTVTISNPPGNLTGVDPDDLSRDQFLNISQSLINTYQLNQLGSVLNLTILSFEITQPFPDSSSDAWRVFATVQQNPTVNIAIPSSLQMSTHLVPVHGGAAFQVQPVLKMMDHNNQPVGDLGSIQMPWKLTATLVTVTSQYSSSVALIGTSEVSYSNGMFTFTDLGVSHTGVYKILFTVTDPTTATHFNIQSNEFHLTDRQLSPAIVSQPTSVTAGATFDVSTEIVDAVTKAKVMDIGWKGQTWTAAISLYLPGTFNQGSLSGPINTPVTVDQSTGMANFSGLSINNKGRYFMAIHYVSTPAGYDFVAGADKYIDVNPVGYQAPATDKTHRLKMKFKGDFATTVQGHEDHFSAALHNKMWDDYSEIVFSDYSVYSGSIVVEFNAAGTNTNLDLMLQAFYKQLQAGFSIEFNGQTYTADDSLYVNGESYGDDDDHEMPVWVIVLITLGCVALVGVIAGFLIYKFYKGRMPNKGYQLDKREPTMKRRGLTNVGQEDDYYKVHIPEDQGSTGSLSSSKDSQTGDDKPILSHTPKSTHFDFLNVRPRTSYKAPNLLPPLESKPSPDVMSSTSSISSRPTSTSYLQLQMDRSTLSEPQ